MKKKNLLLILSMVFVLVLAGCNASNDKPVDSGKDVGETSDDFPKNKVTVIVPFKAGGSLDLMVRTLQPFWEKELGTNIVVENYDGAATLVGTTQFMAQPADGYTVLAGTQPYLSSSILGGNAKYDIDDFDLINFQQLDPSCITVPADSPYKTLDDLIADIKANPGQLKCGTVNGGASHVLIEILKDEFDLDYKFITFDSGNDYRTALIGGHVDFVASSAQGDTSLGDAVRVLALCGDERLSAWPDTPTFDEVFADKGIEIPTLGSGRLLAVQPAVQKDFPERFEKLRESYEAAFNNPEYQEKLKASGEEDTSSIKGNEGSNKMNNGVHETMLKYKDIVIGD